MTLGLGTGLGLQRSVTTRERPKCLFYSTQTSKWSIWTRSCKSIFSIELPYAGILAFLLADSSHVTIFYQSDSLNCSVALLYVENVFIGSGPGFQTLKSLTAMRPKRAVLAMSRTRTLTMSGRVFRVFRKALRTWRDSGKLMIRKGLRGLCQCKLCHLWGYTLHSIHP